METEYQKHRKEFVRWTKEQLTGFKLPDDILVGINPLERFFSGILFPLQQGNSESDLMSNEVEEKDASEAQAARSTKSYSPPSSAGFSFFITGNTIELRVNCQAVHYNKQKRQRDEFGRFVQNEWKRILLAPDDGEERVFTPNGDSEYFIFDDKARLNVTWRSYKHGYIVTISISNCQKALSQGSNQYIELNNKSLFEVSLDCFVQKGNVADYPGVDRALLSEEEKEVELRYKDIKTLAVGHGTGVDWFVDKFETTIIKADFMPTVEIPQITANTGGRDSDVLQFELLQSCVNNPEVFKRLRKFVEDYEDWIEQQKQNVKNEQEEDQQTAAKLIKKLNTAQKRMQDGINLLENDDDAKFAFGLANTAMFMQMTATDNTNTTKGVKYGWRPFQLAFVLMTLNSTADEDDEYRDVLDLIWFPTGGGKTEAYLGLLAFLMIYRRLRYPTSYGGTVAIMRYTLRLLTAQQFTRAAKVICALELLRRSDIEKLGNESFSIGLWVGKASSPNTCTQAHEHLNKGKYAKFIITSCPWCGALFSKSNYLADQDSFKYVCNDHNCDFGKSNNNILPCNTVDQMLYEKPPGLLIATVDKFAALAWDERPGAFFGSKGNRPPELIIQDELHLIASELGSITGLYELGIDALLEKKGVRPKYIASTATVKNAASQVQALYAREMAVFPPSGLRYDDSYFAKTISLEEKPGRMYIGFLAPFLARTRCLSPLTATLLAAPIHLFRNLENFMDNWWSQVIYHGSLKGVGNSRTLYQTDVLKHLNRLVLESMKNSIEEIKPGYLEDKRFGTIEDYEKISDPEIKQIVNIYLPVRNLVIKTLTSRQTAEENNKVFDELTKEYHQNGAIDILLATNMISVGLDVARLSVMIINGQPLTTAEYIQASSRVGRSKVPGLVFVNYYKTQARSLSHYENFRSYHESFYRFVEPSSITPFTYQARNRALHAALVIAARHSIKHLSANEGAEKFNKNDDEVSELINILHRRISDAILPFSQNSDEDRNYSELEEIQKQTILHLEKRIIEWEETVLEAEQTRQNLYYKAPDKSGKNLLVDFSAENLQGDSWQTLRSTRNVENNGLLKILQGVKLPS